MKKKFREINIAKLLFKIEKSIDQSHISFNFFIYVYNNVPYCKVSDTYVDVVLMSHDRDLFFNTIAFFLDIQNNKVSLKFNHDVRTNNFVKNHSS